MGDLFYDGYDGRKNGLFSAAQMYMLAALRKNPQVSSVYFLFPSLHVFVITDVNVYLLVILLVLYRDGITLACLLRRVTSCLFLY